MAAAASPGDELDSLRMQINRTAKREKGGIREKQLKVDYWRKKLVIERLR